MHEAHHHATSAPTLWTIGHSTRPMEVFIDMLRAADVTTLVDVRRYAGSRRNPQYSPDAMPAPLGDAGIAYVPMADLGGRRKPRPDTPHTAWRNESFRGYADYMDTAGYQRARAWLAERAAAGPTAIMCAEAMWWQCHRSLISDDFKADGWTVLHLMTPGRTEEHPWTSAARIVDGHLDYSAPPEPQGTLF